MPIPDKSFLISNVGNSFDNIPISSFRYSLKAILRDSAESLEMFLFTLRIPMVSLTYCIKGGGKEKNYCDYGVEPYQTSIPIH